MDYKDNLTNEKLKKKFISQFDLVNYAIQLAENMIKVGREPRVKTDLQNRAAQVLAEIAQNKDQFVEVPLEADAKQETEGKFSSYREEMSYTEMNGYEEKKSFRKSLGN